MRIYDLTDEQGRVYAFEVGNGLLGRRGVCRVAESIPGASIIQRPRLFSGEDEFCEFEVDGRRFKAWEPFGDNSRYWIGPEPPTWCPQVEHVRMAFVRHKPFLGRLLRMLRLPNGSARKPE